MVTVYVDLDNTDSGREISMLDNDLVIEMTFYTADPVFNVELIFCEATIILGT